MSVLHPTQKIHALIPSQLADFACIGADCPDNCCTGWNVTIDRKTFNAYKKSDNLTLKEQFDKDIQRNQKASTDALYGSMKLETVSGQCSFMKDKLCSVQFELGEDLLSNTCYSYPRLTYRFDGLTQQGFEMSCPEVAQKVLLNPAPLKFEEADIHVRSSTLQEPKTPAKVPPDLRNDIRFAILRLVRDAQLPLWQRLAAMGVLCSQLDPLLEKAQYTEVKQHLESFMHLLDNHLIAANFDNITAHPAAQLRIFKSVWHLKQNQFQSAHQLKIFEKILAGMRTSETAEEEKEAALLAQYVRGLQRSRSALQNHPHFMENFLVAQMFIELFPFKTATLYESFLRLITRFGVIRFMLAFHCAGQDSLPEPAELAATVQVFCRKFEHDQLFTAQVTKALLAAGMNQLERVIYFLRDDIAEANAIAVAA